GPSGRRIARPRNPGQAMPRGERRHSTFAVGEDADRPALGYGLGRDQPLECSETDDAGKIIAGEGRQPVIGPGGNDQLLEAEKGGSLRPNQQRFAALLVKSETECRRPSGEIGCSPQSFGKLLGTLGLKSRAAAQALLGLYEEHVASR